MPRVRLTACITLISVLVTALPLAHGAASARASSEPDPAHLLRLADAAMSHFHSLHAVGWQTSRDPHAQWSVHIVGDCLSRPGRDLPVVAASTIRGWYSQGRSRAVDEAYILIGSLAPMSGRPARAWQRTPASLPTSRWVAVPFWLADNRSYVDQTCPSRFRFYLTGYLNQNPYIQRVTLGQQTLNGRVVWHVRQAIGFTMDFFIDVHTHHLLRLILAGNIGTTWQVGFDYARFNEAVAIKPPISGGK